MIEKLDTAIDECWRVALEDSPGPVRPADVRELFLEQYPETADFYREQMFRSGLMRKISERAKVLYKPIDAGSNQGNLFDLLPGVKVQRAIPISSGADSARVAIEKATRMHIAAWVEVEVENEKAAASKRRDTEAKAKFLLAIMRDTDTVGEALKRYREAA